MSTSANVSFRSFWRILHWSKLVKDSSTFINDSLLSIHSFKMLYSSKYCCTWFQVFVWVCFFSVTKETRPFHFDSILSKSSLMFMMSCEMLQGLSWSLNNISPWFRIVLIFSECCFSWSSMSIILVSLSFLCSELTHSNFKGSFILFSFSESQCFNSCNSVSSFNWASRIWCNLASFLSKRFFRSLYCFEASSVFLFISSESLNISSVIWSFNFIRMSISFCFCSISIL